MQWSKHGPCGKDQICKYLTWIISSNTSGQPMLLSGSNPTGNAFDRQGPDRFILSLRFADIDV